MGTLTNQRDPFDGSNYSTPSTAPPKENSTTAEKKRILVVEDDDFTSLLIQELLDFHGYSVLRAADAVDAYRLANELHPDLILMDIQLSDSSGLEATKWIREVDALRDTPIVAVTAFAMREDQRRIMESGCDAYIAKPFHTDYFLKTISQLVGAEPQGEA